MKLRELYPLQNKCFIKFKIANPDGQNFGKYVRAPSLPLIAIAETQFLN